MCRAGVAALALDRSPVPALNAGAAALGLRPARLADA